MDGASGLAAFEVGGDDLGWHWVKRVQRHAVAGVMP